MRGGCLIKLRVKLPTHLTIDNQVLVREVLASIGLLLIQKLVNVASLMERVKRGSLLTYDISDHDPDATDKTVEHPEKSSFYT